MATQPMPAAEAEVSAELVAALIRSQHPDLAHLALEELTNGWDNVIFRLGDDFTVRLPRREMSARLVDHEQTVLPHLAPTLPIPIPAPIRVGRPGLGYPWSWSINPWLPGTIAATTPFADQRREAIRLGEFLAALHRAAPADAPTNPYRGGAIAEKSSVFGERVAELDADGVVDADALLARWDGLVDVEEWPHPPVWIHGDLHPANVLVDDGAISGVIDFGDISGGDPATDLACAWALFDDADARRGFRAAAGEGERRVDDATWQRAEAWALHFAVTYLVHSADNPTMAGIGHHLLAALSP